jgi:hypothetical protein
MTKITVKAKKKRAIKCSLFYLQAIFRNSLQANRYFGPIHGLIGYDDVNPVPGPPGIKREATQ